MSTLSIAPQVRPVSDQDRVRALRPRTHGPSFDFDAPVRTLGRDDPAVRVLEVPAARAAEAAPQVQEPRLAPAPAPAGRSVRLTRRGRLTLTLTFLGLLIAAMVAVGGGWATASLSSGEPVPVRVVEVQPGDTLYGLAATVAEPGEVREMVYRIQELNSLPSAGIAEGQKLAVPRG